MSKLIVRRIERLLREEPLMRDSDNRLLIAIWMEDMSKAGCNPMAAIQFFKFMLENKLTSSESVRRTRQKLQMDNPNLRGERYHNRSDQQGEWQEELRYGKQMKIPF